MGGREEDFVGCGDRCGMGGRWVSGQRVLVIKDGNKVGGPGVRHSFSCLPRVPAAVAVVVAC